MLCALALHSPKPMVKGTLEGRSVVQVACGLTFSVLLTSDGAYSACSLGCVQSRSRDALSRNRRAGTAESDGMLCVSRMLRVQVWCITWAATSSPIPTSWVSPSAWSPVNKCNSDSLVVLRCEQTSSSRTSRAATSFPPKSRSASPSLFALPARSRALQSVATSPSSKQFSRSALGVFAA